MCYEAKKLSSENNHFLSEEEIFPPVSQLFESYAFKISLKIPTTEKAPSGHSVIFTHEAA